MIKKNLKVLIITSIIILLPILAGVVLWDQLPDPMPTHWNAAGEIDGWSSKPFAVFVLPLILLAIQWLCMLGTAADPKKKNHPEDHSSGALDRSCAVCGSAHIYLSDCAGLWRADGNGDADLGWPDLYDHR